MISNSSRWTDPDRLKGKEYYSMGIYNILNQSFYSRIDDLSSWLAGISILRSVSIEKAVQKKLLKQ